ncbi:hypothetical protein U9M48_021557 [Paspalum notatum var. saurae]|uniref:starch synthase n=1 Tax=Paspalum notatum var. saurae TaxID=547442 RepID=A0AAQ3TJB4_PASNO
MEPTRLVVGAALQAPPLTPPTPQFRRRRLTRPRGGAHCIAPAARPMLLVRCANSRKGNGDSRGGAVRWVPAIHLYDDSTLLRLGASLTDEQSEGGIAELFSLAQRNILYINKQRLKAMEELNKLQDENKLLLEELEALETQVQGVSLQTVESSSFCDILLRIDTMVISGMISVAEASDLREKILNNRSTVQSTFSAIHLKPNTELLSELQLFLRKPTEKPLHVVHICSEMDPIASCESLSTYVASLSREIQRNGNLVEVILPKYTSLNMDGIHGLRKAEVEYESYFGGLWHKNRIWTGSSSGVGLILIEPVQLSYFTRDRLRGYPDDFERFSYFSRASLDYIVKSGKRPDILHIHNWETAIVAPLFWDIFAHQGLGNTRILLTCQDLNSEGGIVYSNKVILMSSTHSKDALIQGLRHGLQATLTAHKEKILIASHGLDGELWDPSKDIYLPRQYSANDIEGKSICKEALKRRLGFRGSSIVVGCICDGDSDIHSLKEAVHVALRRNAQGGKITFIEGYDEAIAHLIYAGSDIILCSSFQDPSLQIAMKAIKYGSVPVRINFPSDESRQSEGHGSHNISMSQYIISTFGDLSLSQALDDLKNDPSRWDRWIRDGMARGLSWDAKCYNLHWDAYSSIRSP